MVGAEGFEPPTLCSQSRCATRLRYAPTDPSYQLAGNQAQDLAQQPTQLCPCNDDGIVERPDRKTRRLCQDSVLPASPAGWTALLGIAVAPPGWTQRISARIGAGGWRHRLHCLFASSLQDATIKNDTAAIVQWQNAALWQRMSWVRPPLAAPTPLTSSSSPRRSLGACPCG